MTIINSNNANNNNKYSNSLIANYVFVGAIGVIQEKGCPLLEEPLTVPMTSRALPSVQSLTIAAAEIDEPSLPRCAVSSSLQVPSGMPMTSSQ